MATVFLLPGQGSQQYHMGKELYLKDSVFRKHMDAIDNEIREQTGQSTIERIYNSKKSKADVFDEPGISGVSILLLELALVRTLIEKAVYPDLLLGASLGTFVASIIAGCVDIKTAVQMLLEHENIFKNHCENGLMTVILDSTDIFYEDHELMALADLSAEYFERNFLISFPDEHLQRVTSILDRKESQYHVLAIKRAFHSRWVEGAREPFLKLYGDINWANPNVSIVCTSVAATLPRINADILWEAVRKPIFFLQTITNLEKAGPHTYIDAGPSGVLSNNLEYILGEKSGSEIFRIISPFSESNKNMEKLLNARSFAARRFYG